MVSIKYRNGTAVYNSYKRVVGANFLCCGAQILTCCWPASRSARRDLSGRSARRASAVSAERLDTRATTRSAATSSSGRLAVLQDVDAIVAARSLDDLMKTEDAEALRSTLAALHEFPELDGFIATSPISRMVSGG